LWQRLVYLTERFSKQYLKINTHCGRMEEIATEIDEVGTVLPLNGELRAVLLSVHLDPCEVEKHVRLKRGARLRRSEGYTNLRQHAAA
jgi:hypothetical protein